METKALENFISSDNTQKVKYIILFFVFFVALSQNAFQNIFGCKLKPYFNNVYIKHIISLLFLFLLIDINIGNIDNENPLNYANPLYSLIYTILIYVLVFLLLHCNNVYIFFIILLLFILIILDRIKQYNEFNISDQEVLQENLGFIYKMNNVFVVIIILAIIIGSLSSLDMKSLMQSLRYHNTKCV